MAAAFEAPWAGIGVGGNPALDFANTLDWRLRETPVERLVRYEDLARWGRSAGFLSAAGARNLRRRAAVRPREAARALRDATATREAIAAVFQAIAHGSRPPEAALARLERACREAAAARTLRSRATGARWEWRDAVPALPRPALAAALAAEALLLSGDATRVRQCGDAQCGWLFLDVTRNRSRRWCTMAACGNRNKARRFSARATGARQPARRRPIGTPHG